ncbi:MAG: DUF4954 family protein, partial [Prevotellaceae bacterium]|nr:DUF4954 family protein [Prevotellaceae bacterium]
ANYEIKSGCFITNVGTLSCTRGTAFGNGTLVAAVNENGGRKIPIFDQLSAQIAHILVFHRISGELLEIILNMIEKYVKRQKKLVRGVIGEQTKIVNCRAILNVKIGNGALVSGAELLENGSINSDFQGRTLVGAGVIAKNFIFSTSAKITDGALIERCFVGQGSEISKGFSATDCLIFSNCELMNGEAVSLFAAPYTVSHHKSNLLIACALSFANIGSGTNMSNHAYKLGAVHQGVMERGCKFASNSYLLFPAHIGAFSVIFGSHKNHPNIADLPFSYLMEENGQSVLIPAVNLFRIGTLRDVNKWQNRDKRQGEIFLDTITYDFLNPLIIIKIENAIKILNDLREKTPDAEYFEYGNCKIHRHSLKKAVEYYQDALTVFMGEYLVHHCGLDPQSLDKQTILKQVQTDSKIEENIFKFDEWVDLSGLILPKDVLFNVWHYILVNNKPNFQYLNEEFKSIENMYQELAGYFTENFIVKQNISPNEILEQYFSVIEKISKRLEKEAATEFFGNSKISYGVDLPKYKDRDFENVRGHLENDLSLQNILEKFKKN